MRVVIDRDFCQGHGVCCEEAPEVFALDDAGELVLRVAEPDPSLRPMLERAVRLCPTRALALEDDG